MAELGRLLTVPEAAQRLRIAAPTMYGLVAAGDIPSVRVTRRTVRVPENCLEQWLLDQVDRRKGSAEDGA